MFLDQSSVNKLDELIGTIAIPHRILYDGEWIDTGCWKWLLRRPDLPTTPPLINADIEEVVIRIGKLAGIDEIPFDADRYAKRFKKLLTQESKYIQDEYRKFIQALGASAARIDETSNVAGRNQKLFRQVRNTLCDLPVIAYKGDLSWVSVQRMEFNSIVIAQTTNQFEILRIERTDGTNRGLSTEDLITELQKLDQEYSIDIMGVSSDALEFKLSYPPKERKAKQLGNWLLQLAPDIYEAPLTFKQSVALWWD